MEEKGNKLNLEESTDLLTCTKAAYQSNSMVKSPKGFEKLFERNVPHVQEKIFFSLNYDSFKTCGEVCRAWNELMKSESYEWRRIELMMEKIAMLKTLVKRAIKSQAKVLTAFIYEEIFKTLKVLGTKIYEIANEKTLSSGKMGKERATKLFEKFVPIRHYLYIAYWLKLEMKPIATEDPRRERQFRLFGVRQYFTTEQLTVLHCCYQANPSPSSAMIETLAEMTGLSQHVARVWFNRMWFENKGRNWRDKMERSVGDIVPKARLGYLDGS